MNMEVIVYGITDFTANLWQFYTILALITYGVYQYLVDKEVVSFREKCFVKQNNIPSSVAVTSIIAGSALFIVIINSIYIIYMLSFISESQRIINTIVSALLFGVFQGALFYFVQDCRFKAREVFSQPVVQSVTRLNVLIVLLVGWTMLGESEEIEKVGWLEFSLIAISIYLFSEKSDGNGYSDTIVDWNNDRTIHAVIFLLLATFASASIQILSKYAVGPSQINIFLFMLASNIFIYVAAFYVNSRTKSLYSNVEKDLSLMKRKLFKKGAKLGILNLVSFSALLMALSIKEASIVIPLYSLFIIVPILLSGIFDEVKLSERITVGTILCVLSILVMSI